MSEWFREVASVPVDLTLAVVLARLLQAALFGAVVASIYYLVQKRGTGDAFPFASTIVLLTILVTMSTLVIGDNVARAFSLVGALSIVRFRTVVDDTRDTAFVIFAVVVGMAIGAGNVGVCIVGVPITALVAMGLSVWGRSPTLIDGRRLLEVRLGGGCDPDALLAEVLNRHASSFRLIGVTTSRQGTALDVVYRVRLRRPDDALQLVKELGRMEGVHGLELKADSAIRNRTEA